MVSLRAHDLQIDTLLIEFPFELLQIINVKDPNWWQAKHIGQNEVTGLIPSQELEERRKAFVPPEADFVHSISICGTKVSASETNLKSLSKYHQRNSNDFRFIPSSRSQRRS